jgi:hypothetical protein
MYSEGGFNPRNPLNNLPPVPGPFKVGKMKFNPPWSGLPIEGSKSFKRFIDTRFQNENQLRSFLNTLQDLQGDVEEAPHEAAHQLVEFFSKSKLWPTDWDND